MATIEAITESKEKLWTPAYIFLLVLSTITSTAFFMITPTISKYAVQLGAGLTVAGIVSGLFSITALVSRPLGGVIVDRINKKHILVAATFGLGISALGYSFSSNVPILITFRVIHGLFFGVSSTASVALLSTYIPAKRLGEGIGFFGLAQILATAGGPSIGFFIGDLYGLQITFLSSAFLLLAAATLMTRIPYTNSQTKGDQAARQKISLAPKDLISLDVLPLALFGGVFSFSAGLVTSFLALMGDERGIKNIGLYFTVNALCLVVSRPLAGRLSDKKGLSFIMYPALIMAIGESILLAKGQVLWVILIAAVIKAFGQGSAQPTLQAACLRKLGPSKSGLASSTYFIGADIGQGLGPIIGGAISTGYGYGWMFITSAILLAVSMVAYFFYNRNHRIPETGLIPEPSIVHIGED